MLNCGKYDNGLWERVHIAQRCMVKYIRLTWPFMSVALKWFHKKKIQKQVSEANAADPGSLLRFKGAVWGCVVPFCLPWVFLKIYLGSFRKVIWKNVIGHCAVQDTTLSVNVFAKLSLFYKYLRGFSRCSFSSEIHDWK